MFAFAALNGRKRLNLLRDPQPALPNPAPSVTLLIPCKDEEARIAGCIESALAQDYPDFDVIAIDDRSIDATPRVMDELAARNPRLSVLHLTQGDLPAGWTGKNNALHKAAHQARGQWLVFIDSDVTLAPEAVSKALAVGTYRGFDLVSFVPRFESHTFWEALIVPLCGAATSGMYRLTFANNGTLPNTAFACGQFIAIRRETYDWMGGHARFRDRFCEDVEIARYLKRSGKRPRLGWGEDLVSVRMYSSFSQIFRGWARNFFAGSLGKPWRVLGAIAFVLLCGLSFIPAVAWGLHRNAHPLNALAGWGWLATAATHWGLMTMCLAASYRWSGNKKIYALLFPLGAAILLAIFVKSLWTCLTGRVEWRGTKYAHRMAVATNNDVTPAAAGKSG